MSILNVVRLKKIFLFILLSLFILSCESTDDKQTLKQIAITLIANYAEGTGPAPTIRNYEDAGIVGVNQNNINELNSFIETLKSENIDTEKELNEVIDNLGASLDSDIFAPVITLHGPNPLELQQGDTYKKVCATAIDNHDGEVTVYVQGNVNTNKLGTYLITYAAVDTAGNFASLDRVIHVVEKTLDTPNGTDDDSTSGGGTNDGTDGGTDSGGTNDGTDEETDDDSDNSNDVQYTIGGTATGITGTAVLKNNTGNTLSTLTVENGIFTFDMQLAEGNLYNITILFPPLNQTCTLENASGVIGSSNITNILLTCEDSTPPTDNGVNDTTTNTEAGGGGLTPITGP